MKHSIGVVGGDMRQRYLAQFFIDEGIGPVYGADLCPSGKPDEPSEIPQCGFYTLLEKAEVVAAPIPITDREGNITGTGQPWIEFAGGLSAGQTVFGGLLPGEMIKYLRRKGVRFCDYMKSEQVALKNGVATAEGAIAEAIRLWPENLQGCSCMVLGYGRCGRLLALRLKALGAKVCVYARRKEIRVQAQTEGMETVSTGELERGLSHCPLVFNTIPALVLEKNHIQALPAGHLLLELASGTGCVSESLEKTERLCRVSCLGLPGKYAPKASAEILGEYIMEMLQEQQQ